jgi:hypothetical protein
MESFAHQQGDENSPEHLAPRRVWWHALAAGLWLALLAALTALPMQAAIRFDLFIGYDSIVPQGAWFPATFEIFNDGQPFNAKLEISSGQFAQNQTRTMMIELPKGTTKRFIPIHTSATYRPVWTARLLDEKDRVRAETQSAPVRRLVGSGLPLAAAISRASPTLPELKNRASDAQPIIARLQPLLVPDNPLVLDGLDTIYLASERVLELKQPQVTALMAWLHGGGHLIVGVEQMNHLTGPGDWLRQVLPMDLTTMKSVNSSESLQSWVAGKQRFDGRPYYFSGTMRSGRAVTTGSGRNPFEKLEVDGVFNQASLQVASGTLRDGEVLIGPSDAPLVVTARRGRGQVTLLTFAPELEPFKTWKNAPYFWAKMTDLPPEILSDQNAANNFFNTYSGRSLDGVFGAMIDSKQVRKLPVGWLLLLLLAYLAVIGPIDQYWLKKINRQMLTWITFPAYVAFFSLLIYFIGYKLRAGESEWNELHVVDVIPIAGRTDAGDLRGRTFASIYSPVNARYNVSSDQPFATLRGEVMGNAVNAAESSRANVEQNGNSFNGTLTVPVWTSQLFVSDWLRQNPPPIAVSQVSSDLIKVENRLDLPLQSVRLVVGDQVLELGDVPAKGDKVFSRKDARKTGLSQFVNLHANNFNYVIDSRQRAFGGNERGRIENLPDAVAASCFISLLNTANNQYNNFATPPGFDLLQLTQGGDAVLLAWVPGYSPIKSMNKFSPRRAQKDTLLRVVLPVKN